MYSNGIVLGKFREKDVETIRVLNIGVEEGVLKAEIGENLFIDHGNGYTTIYRSGTEPKVKEGDEVARGALLYEMKQDDDNEWADIMAYQMIKDGEYIMPTDVLEING